VLIFLLLIALVFMSLLLLKLRTLKLLLLKHPAAGAPSEVQPASLRRDVRSSGKSKSAN
jgi:hypothetical protein